MDRSFLNEVSRRSGLSFEGCFHCLSCSGGCPIIEAMDYSPNQIIRLMQFGMKKEVLESRTIWLCLGCFSCLSQCPNRIHIPTLMDVLREMALEEGVRIAEPDVMAFHREFLRQIKMRGRVFELEFMMLYKLAGMSFFKDMGQGLKMLLKGRFNLFPSGVRNKEEIRRIMRG